MWSLTVLLDGEESLLLWEEDEQGADDRCLAAEGLLIAFNTDEALRAYALAHSLKVADEPLDAVDLDAVAAWCRSDENPDPVLLLSAWNLFGDVARGIGRMWQDRSDELDRLYDLLFWGNNLPVMTPEGGHFVPQWSAEDVTDLRHVMERGLRLVRAGLNRI